MPRRPKVSEDDAISYAQDMLLDAMRTGYADPLLLVECVHYAAEPEVIALTRAFAALDDDRRMEVMRIVHSLSRGRPRASRERQTAH